MATVTLPAYVEHGGEAVFPHPFQARGVHNYSFILEGNLDNLTATLARHFGEPSGGEVEIVPTLPYVLLSIAQIDAIKPVEPPFSEITSGCAEIELALWVMARDVRRERDVYFSPYLFVDSGAAMAGGREAFGFPKQHGRFTLGAPLPDRLSLDVLSVPTFGPGIPTTMNRLIDVERVQHVAAPPWSTIADLTSGLATVLASVVRHPAAITRLAASMVIGSGDRFPMVFLKQFRDIISPDRACYQAITTADIEITNDNGGGLLAGHAITLHDVASEPIRRDLGLADGVLTPIVGVWRSYDFVLGRGAEVWRAPHD
jgi:Acetoacetate decarboxylase (ADC)